MSIVYDKSVPGSEEILTKEAVDFLTELHFWFDTDRKLLLSERATRQKSIDEGNMPDFLSETEHIRNSDWEISPVLDDLQDRRVEITGPTDRKMVINALNSGANVFMADFEDSNSPTWENLIQGQLNIRDAVNKTIEFTNPAGKHYKLNDKIATLMVRPRGWHLLEKHFVVYTNPISASLFDFGLHMFHCAKTKIESGSGPYFYLPKLQSYREAWLWNSVFIKAQNYLGIPEGTIKATVLIEHVLAALETEEILYQLRTHSAGLNCGRWDYIFSFIKTFQNHPQYVFPDRSKITMSVPFMHNYCLQVIKTCHKRKTHAMGGMAAQIPIKNDPEANTKALDLVRVDKTREVINGHDGTWVAHPGLVSIALEAFATGMNGPNQIDANLDIPHIKAEEILEPFNGDITPEGVKSNISIGVRYLESWLRGKGCVPLYNLMEDLATAEISRSQIWQWLRHKSITPEAFDSAFDEVYQEIFSSMTKEEYSETKFEESFFLFRRISTDVSLTEFLTLPAYELLILGDRHEPAMAAE